VLAHLYPRIRWHPGHREYHAVECVQANRNHRWSLRGRHYYRAKEAELTSRQRFGWRRRSCRQIPRCMSARDHSHDRNRSERKAGRPRYGTLDGVCETNMEIRVKELTPC
jgi:hypothetical protein